MSGKRFSRRKILVAALLGSTLISVASASSRTLARSIPWVPGTSPVPRAFDGQRFFTAEERRCVEALVDRLIPADELGPGAREAGVADFIDNQLAGSFGRGERWYMKGPFADGLQTQGYQSELPPADLYRAALAELDAHCRARFEGRVFAELGEGEQDAILKRIEDEELEFESASASTFFALLQDNTVEGFFCDPIYGGNRDMIGWRLVGFPGIRYDYRDYLNHNGAAISIEPVGLMGRPAWNVD